MARSLRCRSGGDPAHGRLIDPEDIADLKVDEAGLFTAVLGALATNRANIACDPAWRQGWLDADAVAAGVIEDQTAAGTSIEESLARRLVAEAPTGSALVVSSSMPTRDIEWYGGSANELTVIANRGANGIDGVVATAIGVALTGIPTTCLIGDVAFLHDASSLTALARRRIDLTIVVTDNDGGGIFSFLRNTICSTRVSSRRYLVRHTALTLLRSFEPTICPCAHGTVKRLSRSSRHKTSGRESSLFGQRENPTW